MEPLSMTSSHRISSGRHVEIELFANEGYVHEAIRAALVRELRGFGIMAEIDDISDIGTFIHEGIKEVPTVRINHRKYFTKDPESTPEDFVSHIISYIRENAHQEVICPVDFSPHATNALRWAYAFARDKHFPLLVTHVYYPVAETEFISPAHTRLSQHTLHARLTEIIDSMSERDPGEIPVHALVDIGEPIHQITRYSQRNTSAFLVIGTRGEGIPTIEKILGSTSTTVAQYAGVPVFLIPPGVTYHKPEKILIACTESILSNGELSQLTELNSGWHAELDFLHIGPKAEVAAFAQLRTTLSKRLAEDTSADVPTSMHMLENEDHDVLEILLDYAQKTEPDLIVLTTRNRSHLRSLLSPGMTRQVARHTRWPLLVLHAV